MRFIVTAGGTTELIDPVRKITNSATGRLGSLVAQSLVAQGDGKIETIHYVCERGAVVPELDCLDLVRVGGVAQTKQALEELLGSGPVDAVIHSMAVSDYAVRGITSAAEISAGLSRLAASWASAGLPDERARCAEVAAQLAGASRPPSETTKLPSHIDDLVLLMARTPKLISMVKKLQPATILVGFKLLNQVPQAELLAVARRLQEDDGCDFVLANDLSTISDNQHQGLLIGPTGSVERFATKTQIADGIAAAVIGRIQEIRK